MKDKATAQYNGIVLLTGYLQRLYVVELICNKLGESSNSERFHKAKSLLDESYTILPVFEETRNLTMAQKVQLQLIAKQTEELMAAYFKSLPLSFNEKLAIVGSSLYAEQHVNAGIIRLGELFNVEVNKDFHQRVKFYKDRTQMVDYLVHALSNDEQLEERFLKPIEPWFNEVMRNKNYVIEDFKSIAEMLEFE